MFSSRNRSCCGNEGRKAGRNDSRMKVRTSRIPLSHNNLASRVTLWWVPPRVCHCSRVRSQLGCFDSVCQSPDISFQRWVARRSCLVAAIKLMSSFVSPKIPTGSSDAFILHTWLLLASLRNMFCRDSSQLLRAASSTKSCQLVHVQRSRAASSSLLMICLATSSWRRALSMCREVASHRIAMGLGYCIPPA